MPPIFRAELTGEPSQQESQKLIVLVNFKTAKEAYGANAVALAKKLDQVQHSVSNFEIILAVQSTDIYRITQETNLRIFAQHVDPVDNGPFTGSICPPAVREAGATGTLLNHMEKRLQKDKIGRAVQLSKAAGLTVILCAASIREGKALSAYKPDYIGIEPQPSILGEAARLRLHPEIVNSYVAAIPCRLLFGGGISNKQDIQRIFLDGASGVMISSTVVKAVDPQKILLSLLS